MSEKAAGTFLAATGLAVWLAFGNLGPSDATEATTLPNPGHEFTVDSGRCLVVGPGDRTIGDMLNPIMDVGPRDFWGKYVAGTVALRHSTVIHGGDQLHLPQATLDHVYNKTDVGPCTN